MCVFRYELVHSPTTAYSAHFFYTLLYITNEAGDASDDNNSDYEGGSPSPKQKLPPTPVASTSAASSSAAPPSALRSGTDTLSNSSMLC
jgi:hypothetical protein